MKVLTRENRARYLIALLIFLAASRLPAQDLRNPKFMERAQAGFSDIFNLDYDKARSVFTDLEKEYPQHPAPPLYLASIVWLQEMLRRQDLSLNRFIAPSYFSAKTNYVMPSEERAAFLYNVQKCQDLAKAILQKNSGDLDAQYFQATAYGLRASFAITIDHSVRQAFSYGNKAYSISEKLIEEDPKYYDAYLTAGVYEYIVGSIPWYLKWIMFVIGAHGSKQEGLEHLKLASEKGQYVKNEAQLVLMVLYVREHQYAEALKIARNLKDKYPLSYLFQLNIAQILQVSGHKNQALAILLQVEKQIEAGEPNFDKVPLPNFRLNLGRELMSMGKLDAAEDQFRNNIDDPKAQKKDIALSHLYLGQVLDQLGKPDEAAKEYNIVLSLENVDDSHSRAKKLLKKQH